ncbi:hypothetical protein LSM04_004510 [Trypanosoma melophagium]|uniref:uncharacterized protein n=1 Tax=Trypanosoma melophagium TaxID=715481 RepID=UPI00351A4AC7|nr:hypothetical protein LSM04_004510 [Trypanosoma melophagium]
MSTPLGGRFYHTLTRKSTARVFDLPIPEGHKVLSAGLRAYGATGILSSFYDVERNAWVVQHDPIDHNAAVLLQVVTLVDPDDLYDVVVSTVSLADGMTEEELDILTRRTEIHKLLRQDVSPQQMKGKHNEEELEELGKEKKYLRGNGPEVVSLICPTVDGYTLTGGGFSSGYPVLASYADVRESRSVNRFCLSLTHEPYRSHFLTVNPKHVLCDAVLTERQSHYALSLLSEKVETLYESNAWSVMAAKNPSLRCYAIGLRLRMAVQCIQISCDVSDISCRTFDSSDNYFHSSHAVDGITTPSRNTNSTVADNNTCSNGVKVEHRSQGRWRIELEPPHGKFFFTFGASRASNPVMLSAFYR